MKPGVAAIALQQTFSRLISLNWLLYKILDLKNYLRTLNWSFQLLYSLKILKRCSTYKYHYFDRHLIQKGFYILDMGANLGYYTTLFSKWTGKSGKVYAVEPVSIFFDTLKWTTKKYRNINLLHCALGAENKEVTMATPGRFGYLRTGLPHIIGDSETSNNNHYEYTFKASMKRGSELFKNIPKIDFIKCDIEGYEEVVLPEMKNLLNKFKPIIQLETWGEHKSKTETFLLSMGYEIFDVEHNKLKPIHDINNKEYGDLIFIHHENKTIIEHLKKRKCA